MLSPLEIAATLWRMRTNSDAPLTLLAPCPAKITMVREPFDKTASPLTSAVTVRKVARSIMAEGDINVEKGPAPKKGTTGGYSGQGGAESQGMSGLF